MGSRIGNDRHVSDPRPDCSELADELPEIERLFGANSQNVDLVADLGLDLLDERVVGSAAAHGCGLGAPQQPVSPRGCRMAITTSCS